MNEERRLALIEHLRGLSAETEWAEFKVNNTDPKMIGTLISALSNVACIWGEPHGYMLWGIENGTHNVVGTSFEPKTATVNAQLLELWLAKALSPSPAFKFIPVDHPEGKLILLEVPAASLVPVKFNSIAYLRIGSATPKLSDFPDREADLLSKLKPFIWEHGSAVNFIESKTVLELLDTEVYFRLLKIKTPDNETDVLARLLADRLISRDVGGRWNISNLAAILFARNVANFESVARKALRVIRYDGNTRSKTQRSQEGALGYAAGFSRALTYVDGILPSQERIVDGIRTKVRTYPQIALREVIGNALIHQDMTVTGTGPKVEIFDDRIEVSNPGIPVTDMPKKLFGAPPRSRNEQMGGLMRRMGICEELGSGLVKLITAVEERKLPAPTIETGDGTTKLVLYGPRSFSELNRFERIWICYQHACLMCHGQKWLTNTSLRDRFGLSDDKVALVSRIIRDSQDSGWIKPADPQRPKSGYLPYWG